VPLDVAARRMAEDPVDRVAMTAAEMRFHRDPFVGVLCPRFSWRHASTTSHHRAYGPAAEAFGAVAARVSPARPRRPPPIRLAHAVA
jgi:hypothetical protein